MKFVLAVAAAGIALVVSLLYPPFGVLIGHLFSGCWACILTAIAMVSVQILVTLVSYAMSRKYIRIEAYVIFVVVAYVGICAVRASYDFAGAFGLAGSVLPVAAYLWGCYRYGVTGLLDKLMS